MQDLLQQKHGKATETPEADAAPSAPPATAGAEPMDVDDEEAIEVCASVLEAASADPSREAARTKADIDLARLMVHGSPDAAGKALIDRVRPTQKVAFFVDTATSKTRVAVAVVDTVAAMVAALPTGKVRIIIPVGERPDAVAGFLDLGCSGPCIVERWDTLPESLFA